MYFVYDFYNKELLAAFFTPDGIYAVRDEITQTRLICSDVKERRAQFWPV